MGDCSEPSWKALFRAVVFSSMADDVVVPPQNSKGYEFESETDTEVIPKLMKYVYDNRENDYVSFSTLVERVIQQLVSIIKWVEPHTRYAGEGWEKGKGRG